ncbi:fatty acid synthase alpha subunit Lsd1, partial [Coemansia sp. RSA 552]
GDLYQRQLDDVVPAPNWLEKFGPRLVRTAHDGQVHVDTRMQRILGSPTVMVAGMTPTTAKESFVAAINHAGYHAELAGGGMHSESEMVLKIKALAESISPGQGITLNCIYVNPRQWSFQFPALLRLRSEGLPISGLCIGGGVPSFDMALEIIESLRSVGIRHVSFKPSTAEAIRHVIKVAQASDGFPIVLQWTGGRGGGHHSYEDFHQPILQTYAAIRACDNIALVAGSGFGNAAGSLPYLTGDWSMKYGRAPMPFDGILLGSRVMVAQEAGTSLAAKQLIVAAQGLSNSDWHKTYDGTYGGVTTITSEYGELNHALATRAVVFVREMHETVLCHPRSEQPAILNRRKDEIIARLNCDYMRPWFGRKADGQVVDLEDMTYAEVVDRLVELMYVKHQQRWIHPSHQRLTVDFCLRLERRMKHRESKYPTVLYLDGVDPSDFACTLAGMFPQAAKDLLSSEDVQFFIYLCKRRGQKPVPFIPVLDADFGVLLLKDTAWQSEDLDSVVDQDPQRVLIQQGPVAACYSTAVDEPVKDILDGVYHGHVAALLKRLYNDDVSQVPTVEYIGADPAVVAVPAEIQLQESETERLFEVSGNVHQLPGLDTWLQIVAGPQKSWLCALLLAPAIVQGNRYVDNYVRRMMRPRHGRTYKISVADSLPVSLAVADSAGTAELELVYNSQNGAISLTVSHMSLSAAIIPLVLEFTFTPSDVLMPIHGSRQQEDDAVRQLFIDAWVSDSNQPISFEDITDPKAVLSDELVLTEELSRALCAAVGNQTRQYLVPDDNGHLLALAELIQIPSTRQSLQMSYSSLFGEGQAKIVHLYSKAELVDGARPFLVGDCVTVSTEIIELANIDAGKQVIFQPVIYREGQKVAVLESAILSVGCFVDIARAFTRRSDQRIVAVFPSASVIGALEARQWFEYCDDATKRIEPEVPVEFCLDSEYHYANPHTYSCVSTTGTVSLLGQNGRREHIANVDFHWTACTDDLVLRFLNRYQVDTGEYRFDSGGYSLINPGNAHLVNVTVPESNRAYANCTRDGNPFHLNPYIADFADLPGTITHGYWTSTSTKAILESVAAGGQPERIRAYQTEFIDKVLPGDQLLTKAVHTGMTRDGRMLVTGQTSKINGGSVMTFTAEVEQPATAYVFTGQGSQAVGMGMDLYEQSPAAQAVWDRANAHMLSRYDINLLDVVRTNPTELSVHFVGRVGQQVWHNYLALSKLSGTPVLPDISAQSTSYTFQSPTGLLNSTQFTQVALVANAMASVADLRSQGLVQKDALFAGHSLGEYAALAALGNVFSVEDVLDIVFYRGLIMQSAVPRDEHGRSKFGMAAINPQNVSAALDEETLQAIVDKICMASPELLQVVNYNVSGQQYVAAGTLSNLSILRMVLDGLMGAVLSTSSDIIAAADEIIGTVMSAPIDSTAVRGVATTPLDGVDVPFHSEQLADRVSDFRAALRTKIKADALSLDPLCGHYIPNLTAEPFELSQECFTRVADITGSPVIRRTLDSWDDTELDALEGQERLAEILLTELLAYQLASPVQWIRTQDWLFSQADIRRVVEVGPSPVLCGMADKTLRRPEFMHSNVSVLHVDRDSDSVYYKHVSEETDRVAEMPMEDQQPEPVSAPLAPAPPQSPPSSVAEASGPITDVPLQALDIIHSVVAFKLKQPLSAVSDKKSIKALVGGKSTLQNEIVAYLQKEFGSRMPDKSEELSLQELGSGIGSAGSLGKCTQPLVARMFSGKMPGGFTLSNARSILKSAYGLGLQRQDALLLVALTMEPTSRLGSEAEATAWLDKAAQTYASRTGITFSQTAGAATGAQAAGPVVSSAELENIQQQQYEHAQRQIEVLARYTGIDLRQDGRLAETQQTRSAELQTKLDSMHTELGSDFAEGIMPCFDARKARHFDSYWNWARQDAYEWIQQAISQCMAGTEPRVDQGRLNRLQIRADKELLGLLSGCVNILEATDNPVLKPALVLANHIYQVCKHSTNNPPVYRELSAPMQPHTHMSRMGKVSYSEVPRPAEPTFAEYITHMQCEDVDAPPHIHLREKVSYDHWVYSRLYSSAYFTGVSDFCGRGLSFAGKTALVTGCGRGSIGAEVIRGLLMGGAKVLATTSSYSRKTILFFEDMYRQYGARGSELIVVPFNQGSVQDVEALVSYIYSKPKNGIAGLGWNLDFVIPFAAIADVGSMIGNIGSRSELAQRVALTNVLRLLGSIKNVKEQRKQATRPSLAILPLSPNHGTIGGDGLYSECKIGLETTFNRWEAEGWEGYLSIAGAVIGWTRGTGLMSANNLAARKIEDLGVRTFSTREMAFNILGLLHPQVALIAHTQPVWAGFDGGMGRLGVVSGLLAESRKVIDTEVGTLQLNAKEQVVEFSVTEPFIANSDYLEGDTSPLAKSRHNFPAPKSYESLEHLHHLQDMVNLDKVVVITGYGEVSPHGNAETRWEIEAFGHLSTEGCIELAWIMGLIKHHNGQLSSTGEYYVGWVDAKGGEPVKDIDIKMKYEEYMLAHTGIRLIEPDLAGGYNPEEQEVLREVQIEHDMAPFEASADDAASYKKSNGDKIDAWENSDGSWSVRFLKGALIRVPAAVTPSRLVAALLPTGWDARRFGIPEDTINQVDPVTLFMLVAVVEALVRSGITDPYQLYQHFHISEVGTTISSGAGGMHSARDVFLHGVHDKDINNDALQETFISTVQAWVNMLLMSGAGPVMPVVGACTTAVVSIDAAVKIIQTGRAKVMLAGGVEDFTEESSTGFASMGATSNTIEEFASGRTPPEMSRPCTTTRSGFMEGHGAGAVVLMSAAAAIKCGAPIYGVVGMTITATDKQGRSVPAPGKGILGSACEVKGTAVSRLLDINYRRRKLQRQLQALDAWRQSELDDIPADLPAEDTAHQTESIEAEYRQQRKSIQDVCGSEFWKESPSISPLRGSLATWGLTADDIGLASFHGTATKANDKNESEVLNAQMEYLGRTPGHVLPAVCQKWLTGHPKGAAAAWMLNGVLQSLRTGIIPGNRNADNIDQDLKACDYSLYLSKSIQTPGIKAALLKSFGFGQIGGEMLVVHSDYILATLDIDRLKSYNQRLELSAKKADRYWQDTLVGNHSFVQIKDHPPFTDEQEQEIYLDPYARAHYDPVAREYCF